MWKKKQNKFPGGIHPTDGYDKAMTMDLPVHEYWPETVTILSELWRKMSVVSQATR